MSERCSAVCSPGLAPFAAAELGRLGIGAKGLEFEGSSRDLYRASLRLRTADRLLLKLGEFPAAAFPALAHGALRLPWERVLAPERPIAFRVSCVKSKLYHERAIAERLGAAVERRLGRASPLAKFDENASEPQPQLFFIRVERDRCSVFADASGALLHKRGYRLATAKAPLRETMASALVTASGWTPEAPLLDPFCGSGTIAIEAALMARRIAPGLARRFAFMDWPGFDGGLWEQLKEEAARESTSAPLTILASDRDAGAIRAAQANAERAGVADAIQFSCRAVSAVEPPAAKGWIVTNPPYGVRVGEKKPLRDLYARLGAVLRERCPGWRATILSSDSRLLAASGLELKEGAPMMNGGLTVRPAGGLV
ncbi:MAG TPA: class I SAM-dependent RNA methyltransferase [Elusimicrobiota bacterium]|nr:class I SAM-dependent RNA methyltransferase [Elusimicrobiota bacterium]